MSGGRGALFLEGLVQKHLSPALNERINNYIFEEHWLKTCNNVVQLLLCYQISSHSILNCGSISNRSFNFCCSSVKTPHSHVRLWGPLSSLLCSLVSGTLMMREQMYCGTSQRVSCPNYTEKQQRDANTDISKPSKKKKKKKKHLSLQDTSIDLWLGSTCTNGPPILRLSGWCCAEFRRCFF